MQGVGWRIYSGLSKGEFPASRDVLRIIGPSALSELPSAQLRQTLSLSDFTASSQHLPEAVVLSPFYSRAN